MDEATNLDNSNSEQSLAPKVNESGEVITKDNATPEQKKEYALEKKKAKNLARNAENQARLAEQDKTLKANASKMAELEAKLEAANAPKAPNIDLELDDPEEYSRQSEAYRAHEKMLERREIVKEIRAEDKKQNEDNALADRQRVAREELISKVDNFLIKGESVGLSEDALEGAVKVLNEASVNSDIQNFLLDDENGPQIVEHLATNADDLEVMNKLSPMAQVKFIENTVRAKALLNKPTTSGAPSPLLDIGGGGAQEKDDFDTLYPNAEFK